MKNLIVGNNIVKTFGLEEHSRKVLDGVSIEVNEGEFVSVMGPSGSGKTTLMFALSGLDSVNSGNIHFEGRDYSRLKKNEHADLLRRDIGFVFQQPTLLKNLNILDNIILPSVKDNKRKIGNIRGKALSLMEKMGISGLENRDITEVSGGELQRAGICRALLNSPKIIFGDEPTGALNSKTSHEIMDIFSEINDEGTAVLLVTHDAKVASRTERVLFMKDGKIVSQMRFGKERDLGFDDRMNLLLSKMKEIGI